MHEWALAEAIVAAVAKTARDNELKKVTAVTVKLGVLQNIDHDVFSFAVNELLRFYPRPMAGVFLSIEKEETLLECRACRHSWNFDDKKKPLLDDDDREAIHFIPEVAHIHCVCPVCGSPDFNVAQGRGVRVESIEGET